MALASVSVRKIKRTFQLRFFSLLVVVLLLLAFVCGFSVSPALCFCQTEVGEKVVVESRLKS